MRTLVREHLERRITRPLQPRAAGATPHCFSWPDDDENRAFDLWLRQFPRDVYRGEDAPFCATSSFDEDANQEEPDEELYWGSADEGEERGWVEIGVEGGRGKRKRVASVLGQGGKLVKV